MTANIVKESHIGYRRIGAFVIDLIIFPFFALIISNSLEQLHAYIFNIPKDIAFQTLIFWYLGGATIFYWILIETIFLTSIGKLISGVRFQQTTRIDIRICVFFKNIIRLIILISVFVPFICYIILTRQQICIYDSIVGLKYVIKEFDLTDTQKNWRKFFSRKENMHLNDRII